MREVFNEFEFFKLCVFEKLIKSVSYAEFIVILRLHLTFNQVSKSSYNFDIKENCFLHGILQQSHQPHQPQIVVTGLPHSGRSTISTLLAQQLGAKVIDINDLISPFIKTENAAFQAKAQAEITEMLKRKMAMKFIKQRGDFVSNKQFVFFIFKNSFYLS